MPSPLGEMETEVPTVRTRPLTSQAGWPADPAGRHYTLLSPTAAQGPQRSPAEKVPQTQPAEDGLHRQPREKQGAGHSSRTPLWLSHQAQALPGDAEGSEP